MRCTPGLTHSEGKSGADEEVAVQIISADVTVAFRSNDSDEIEVTQILKTTDGWRERRYETRPVIRSLRERLTMVTSFRD